MPQIKLLDGNKVSFTKSISGFELSKKISKSLEKSALIMEVDGELKDLSHEITKDSNVRIITSKDKEGLEVIRHDAAHIMAMAVQELYPGTQVTIGPVIENGFYYDFARKEPFTSDDLENIEKRMSEIIDRNVKTKREVWERKKAIEHFKKIGEKYKAEIIESIPQNEELSIYHHGDNWHDLCRGPHLDSSSKIGKAFKLTKVSGAYWRGDSNNEMLQRIYGTCWSSKKDLDEYLNRLEEAEKRDHRKLGKELSLFTFSQRVGQGLPLWLPKGAQLRERLENFMRQAQVKAGYLPVVTPHIGSKELYVTSGHYEKYGEDSFQPIKTPNENEEFLLKPMNCPHHCEIYKSEPRSYRDLPLRFAEFGTVYRYEQSGELHGLTRVRGFTQDDAHLFCTAEQVEEEFKKVIDLVLYVFNALGFEDYTAQISLRDKNDRSKYIGSDDNWEKAEQAIINASADKGLNTVVEYGEAAFYGPKLDFMVKDALGRKWQLGTIQVDYNLPERFELEYIGSDDQRHRPVMIHRAPFGSLERFVAVLIEHCGGNFPLWLTPEQVAILPLSEKYNEKCKEVLKVLNNSDIRGFVDDRNEKVGKKIRDAEVSKVPYMLIIGEKEIENGTVSVRKHGEGDKGTMKISEFADFLNKEIELILSKK